MKFDILVLMTSFNRREKTIASLTQLNKIENLHLKVILVDDHSSDGTTEYVAKYFPHVLVINGSGSLFWAKGMKLAENSARRLGYSAKYVLLLNDDVFLFPDVFLKMFHYAEISASSMVGPVEDAESGRLSYGGLVKSGLHPLNFKLRQELDQVWIPDVFHANVALIRYDDFESVEGIDDGFAHAYADFDLALRLSKNRCRILVFNEIVGSCEPNPFVVQGNIIERLTLLSSNKGRPWKSQYKYLRRHTNSSILALIFTISPYIKVIVLKK